MRPTERIASDLRYLRTVTEMAPTALRNRPGVRKTVADEFDRVVDAHPDRIAIVDASDGGREVTFRELGERANRVADWAVDQGIERGSVVALLMLNRPDYVSTWLGLAKVGAVTALINTNLTGETLAHSIRVSGAEQLIVDRELLGSWKTARDNTGELTEWHTGAGSHDRAHHDLDADLEQRPTGPPDRALRRGMTTDDPLFFIYTSGTTGFPKAARFTHGKFLLGAGALPNMLGITSDDRMYVALPLYHTAGGVMALGGPLLHGAGVVLTRKFSASRFWDECVEHDATMFQYIGELCRYLVNSPPHPLERSHKLRIAIGNGLRPDVWPRFQARFRIDRIIEFYGATEGNTTLFNLDNKIGSIGRMPTRLARAAGLRLVEYDVDSDAVRRDARGRCIEVGNDTPGEAIARITRATPFDGYSDPEATERKILRDVFREGDAYFRTGDLLSHDRDGYWYFVDRIGDSFRWKGENVSTTEVAHVLGECRGVLEANVYGVEVPGHDGRAGMAALVVDDSFDIDALHSKIEADLAGYARPLFLRTRTEMDITSTFKHRKRDSVEQGFDPAVVTDPLFFLHPDEGGYVPLDARIHAAVVAGDIRL